MEPTDEQRAHLHRLADALSRRTFRVDISAASLTVTNPDTPDLSEKVLCQQAEDGSWCWWWPWKQPIGAADDLETVAEKIAVVLRSVNDDSSASSPVLPPGSSETCAGRGSAHRGHRPPRHAQPSP